MTGYDTPKHEPGTVYVTIRIDFVQYNGKGRNQDCDPGQEIAEQIAGGCLKWEHKYNPDSDVHVTGIQFCGIND